MIKADLRDRPGYAELLALTRTIQQVENDLALMRVDQTRMLEEVAGIKPGDSLLNSEGEDVGRVTHVESGGKYGLDGMLAGVELRRIEYAPRLDNGRVDNLQTRAVFGYKMDRFSVVRK